MPAYVDALGTYMSSKSGTMERSGNLILILAVIFSLRNDTQRKCLLGLGNAISSPVLRAFHIGTNHSSVLSSASGKEPTCQCR